ncbi:MAG: UDP-glucose 6-dehydrogenase [Pseudonocardiales bacterium]|nr:UDP-glucose 6-dehydrogenase [Pseudonocardiales bacterium]
MSRGHAVGDPRSLPARARPQPSSDGIALAVLGTGYLGATHAICMASLGHRVVGVDSDAIKVEALIAGRVPFYEPDLAPMLGSWRDAGSLTFTTDPTSVEADIYFLCVPTPQEANGKRCDLGPVHSALRALAPQLRAGDVVVGKSTVPVGTAASLLALLRRLRPDIEVSLCWNPEFLREGHAVEDTLRPSRLVLGIADGDKRSEVLLRRVYAPLIQAGCPVIVTDLATAELMKVAANAFLATKISFINAMAQVCDAADADVVTLAEGLGLDPRIGAGSLAPGLGFGGGCLPKDLHALQARAEELGVGDAVAFLEDVDAVNEQVRTGVVSAARDAVGGDLAGVRIAALGAAFKAGSDDVRESPALAVIARLAAEGARVRVYDPEAMARAAIDVPAAEYVASAQAAMLGAELTMVLTEWPEFARIDPTQAAGWVRLPVMIDARHIVDRGAWQSAGWTVRAPGRRPYEPTAAPSEPYARGAVSG